MNFIQYSSLSTKIIYVASVIILLFYLYNKIKQKGYILSIFNYYIYIYIISYIVTSIFQYDDIAWKALGQNSAKQFYSYLDKSLQINLIGVIIFYVLLYIFELKRKKTYKESRLKEIIEMNIDIKLLRIINVILISFWLLLVWSKLGLSFPIFNNNRAFLQYSFFQTIYNILNFFIMTLTIIELLFIISKKYIDKMMIIINIIILLGTGNRTPIFSVFLMWFIYFMKEKKVTIKNIFRYIFLIMGILFCIMIIDMIRTSNFENLIFKIKYGNTFSDIRDGAFILYGMENLKIDFLYGKMYLADFFSFIPSEFLKYRQEYGYSHFTTKYLFNWQGHYGLRGGLFLAPYINFGYMGVIIVSIIVAKIFAFLDDQYNQNKINYKNYFYYQMINILAYSMLLTANFMEFYITLGQIITILFFNKILKYKNKER